MVNRLTPIEKKEDVEKKVEYDINEFLAGKSGFVNDEIPTRNKIMILMSMYPFITNAELARRIGSDPKTIRHIKRHPFFEEFNRDIAASFKSILYRLQMKALLDLREIMLDDDIPRIKKWPMIKYLIDKGVDMMILNNEDQKPDEIIFETQISEGGTLNNERREVFYNV